MTLLCPWVQLQPLALWGLDKSVPSPEPDSSIPQGAGTCVLQGPEQLCGDLRPSTPGLLHAESHLLAIQSAVLFPAPVDTLSQVSPSKEDPAEGMGPVGGPQSCHFVIH